MAQTVGRQNGTLTVMQNSDVEIDFLTEISFEASVAMIDISTKSSAGNREILPGQRSYTFSGTAYFADDATEGYAEMIGELTGRTAATIRFSTDIVGDAYYEASCYISNLSMQAGTEDVKSFSYTYEVTAACTVGVVA